jgi:hypothetical protein
MVRGGKFPTQPRILNIAYIEKKVKRFLPEKKGKREKAR